MELKDLAKLYVLNFIRFLEIYNVIGTEREKYYLLDYIMCQLYNVDLGFFTSAMLRYGEDGFEFFRDTIGYSTSLVGDDIDKLRALVKSYYIYMNKI